MEVIWYKNQITAPSGDYEYKAKAITVTIAPDLPGKATTNGRLSKASAYQRTKYDLTLACQT